MASVSSCFAATLSLLLLLAAPAWARHVIPAGTDTPGEACLRAAAAAGTQAGIPDGLMGRIARVESGAWPWTIDADGTDLTFATQAEAAAWVRGPAAKLAHFVDVGCLQINLQYHPHAFATVEDGFDPWLNARYAATFLRQLYDDESGHDWSVAVGLYHSHVPELAAEYRDRVASIGEGIIQGLPRGTIASRLALLGVIRVPLANGHFLRLILNRQPTMPGYHRPSRCKIARTLAPMMASPPNMAGCR